MLVNSILIIFCSLLLWAIISDVRNYILSNKLCLSVTFLYFIFLGALYINGTFPSLSYILYSIGIAALIFIILATLFAFNLIGGGDVKLIPAVALWAGPSLTIKFLLITTICGGVVSVGIIVLNYFKKKKIQSKSSENVNYFMPKSSELENEENNIPYGIAISIGGLVIAYDLYRAIN